MAKVVKSALYLFLSTLLFFGLLEGGLRLFNYGPELSLFIPAPQNYTDEPHLITNPEVARRYFPNDQMLPRPHEEWFKKKKPANGYRIFVMGGSTALTFPYPANFLFSRILQQRLSEVFPELTIEVVNTSIAAVNSFTLLDFSDEIIAQQPDAIVIYTGHNEFYGALGVGSALSISRERWFTKLYLTLLRFKTFLLVRELTGALQPLSDPGQSKRSMTLMERMIGERSIPYRSEKYNIAAENFETNLSEIMTRFRAARIPVVLSEVVSNLRDQPPFVSLNDSDPTAAELFAAARELEKKGDYAAARSSYERARDLDGLRFRAPGEFNSIIKRIAARHDALLAPTLSRFVAAATGNIIGSELMLEHLHPNAEGYLLLGDTIFQTMRQNGLIKNQWPEERIRPLEFYRRNWPLTELDRAVATLQIDKLTSGYPFTAPGESKKSKLYHSASEEERLARDLLNKKVISIDARQQLAEKYRRAGQSDLMLRELQALITTSPYYVNYYLTAAAYLQKHGFVSEALALYSQSLQIKATAGAAQAAGLILLQQKEPLASRPYLEKAFQLEPGDVKTIYGMGIVEFASGNFTQARRYLEQLEKIEPNSPEAISLRGNLLRYRGE